MAIKQVMLHPDYNSATIDNDVGILITATPLDLTNGASAIELPAQDSDLTSGDVKVSGWGTTVSGGSLPAELRTVDIPAVDRKTCNDRYKEASGGNDLITDQMVCAGLDDGGKDSCQGDSGGPLVQDGKLVGVVSWGYGCAQPNKPGVYARVGSFFDWFNQNKG